jgi:hypothetical protein
MKKRYTVVTLSLLLAGGAAAQTIAWTQSGSYDTLGGGYLPRVANDGGLGFASVFETGKGTSNLAYQTATESLPSNCQTISLSWSPAAYVETNSQGYVSGHAPGIALLTNMGSGASALEVYQGTGDNGAALMYTLGSTPSNPLPCIESYTYPYSYTWSSSGQYDQGYNPTVAIDNYNTLNIEPVGSSPFTTTVVEVHQAGEDLSDLWYHVGTLTYGLGTPSIVWGPSYRVGPDSLQNAYLTGYAPSVSVSNGIVVVAFQAEGGTLEYITGIVSLYNTIAWQTATDYANGYNPSVSLVGGYLVEAHQLDNGTGPLLYLLGQVNINAQLSWYQNSPVQYSTGCYPSAALDGLFGYIAEVHSTACAQTATLEYKFGYWN